MSIEGIAFFNQIAKKNKWNIDNGRRLSLGFGVYKKTFGDIQKKMEINLNDRVLDIGGGTGKITKYIAQVAKEVELSDGADSALAVGKSFLEGFTNISFSKVDVRDRLPFADNKFNKVLCYSVVHYLKDYGQFKNLIKELIRVTDKNGKILIGDIPLLEKYEAYLGRRKLNFWYNFLKNLQYHFKKYLTDFIYFINGIRESSVDGMFFTKEEIKNILGKFEGIDYLFFMQDQGLPYATSREDLFILKKGL